MKVKTNAGEVELTAEMVCRGMVFEWGCYSFTVADPDQHWVVGGERVCGHDLPRLADQLLGCDPEYASRADCERFGVHGDAAAHGFARLRNGGAVDLWHRRAPLGTVNGFKRAPGRAYVDREEDMRPLLCEEVFVGLRADLARPEDVERLCCGKSNITSPDSAFVGPRACSLAIGPHDEHEDLATGVRWRDPPKPRGCPECTAGEGRRCAEDCPRVARYKATRCGARPVRGQVLSSTHPDTWLCATGEERCDNDAGKCSQHTFSKDSEFFHWAEFATFWNCPICTQQIMPYGEFGVVGFGVYDPKAGRSREAPVCEACYKAYGNHVVALRWEGDRLVLKTGAEVVRAEMAELAEQLKRFPRCKDCDYIVCDDDCPRVRREKEAPLVALVNNVPAGLDPIGWRAAVLAETEAVGHRLSSVDASEFREHVTAAIRGSADLAYPHAKTAYHRALAPRSKVAPERKMRGPVVVVDDGRDE